MESELKALSSEIEEKEEALSLLEEKRDILTSKHSDLESSTIEQVSFEIRLGQQNLNDIKTKRHLLELEISDTEISILIPLEKNLLFIMVVLSLRKIWYFSKKV